MEYLFSVICLLITTTSTQAQPDREGPCFEFPGDSFLNFTSNNFDNNNDIHYSLQFRTIQPHAVLLYSRGHDGDYESLFIRNGRLHYLLFNTSPTGVEGYFGAYHEGQEMVNIGQWIKVDIFRSWRHVEPPQRRVKRKTGFEVEVDGERYSYLDFYERTDISLQPSVFLGGFIESLSSTVRNLTGQIKNVYEEKNNFLFENWSYNFHSKVSLSCVDFVDPN